MKSPHTGIKRIIAAFGYSFDGIAATFKSESAFRQDILIYIVGIIALLLIPVGVTGKLLMFMSLSLIPLMELINTALETIVDRIGSEYNPLSKKAKDIGSALVLIAFIITIIVWGTLILELIFC